MKGVEPSSLAWKAIALPLSYTRCFSCLYRMFHYSNSFHWCFIEFLLSGHPFYVVGSTGFEPVKALPSDLQSDPFDRSGNSPSQNVVENASFLLTSRGSSSCWSDCFSQSEHYRFSATISYRPRPIHSRFGRQARPPSIAGIRTTTQSSNGSTSNSFPSGCVVS